MLTLTPGSLDEYAPGKLTKLEPELVPLPDMLIWAHLVHHVSKFLPKTMVSGVALTPM